MVKKYLIKKWTRKWWFLKSYLAGQGYRIYPTEITCSLAHCEYPDRSFVADVAACKKENYYAFEYKSLGDSIASKRLMEQISNYSVSFDYVIVVAEVNEKGKRREASLRPNWGSHLQRILKLGAGFWTVFFPQDTYNPDKPPVFKEIAEPKRQSPHPENKQWIINKFSRYVYGIPVAEDPNQTKLIGY